MAIKIKKANRGKFNATKARTGKTTEELTHSTNPVTKKRAIFAQNAAKWKHEDGGKTKVKDLAEEGFNPLNRNHWAINPTRVIDALQKDNYNKVSNKDVVKSMGFLYGLAGLNRLLPFIKNSPLAIPLKSLAYNQMIKSGSVIRNPIDESTDNAPGDIYRGTMSGDTTRNLNKQYLYGNQPAFEKADSTVITSKYPDRYAKLYPNAEKYIMKSSIPHKDSIDFAEVADFFADNYGMSPSILANKIKAKQNIRVSGDNSWSPVNPLDDVSGHSVELNMKGHPTLVTQDLWKFNPKDYTTRWGSTEYKTLLAQKESAILDKLGNPFYLVQNNPIKNFSTNVDSLLKARYPHKYNNKEGISTNFKDGGIIPKAQEGKNIPISREDYLRQQYQNYLKSQAEKGRKAVVEGREKFAKDYVIPAIKTAASFTPAGLPIGLMDAYKAYQEGNTGWAIAGAAAEALPYAGKVIGKGLSILKNLNKIEVLPSPIPYAHYRNIGGIEGYRDVLNRGEIAPPIIPRSESTGLRSLDGHIRLPKKQFNRAYYAKKGEFSPALRYSGPYAVEAKMPLVNGFGGNWGYAPNPELEGFINAPLDDPRIRLLKQYRLPKTEKVLFQKELPKKEQGGIIPKAQDNQNIKTTSKEGISTNFKDGGNFSPNMIGEVTVTGKRKKPTIPFVPSTIPAIDTNPGIKIPMAYPESDITVSREHIDRVNEGRDPKFRSLVPEQIDRYNMYDTHIKKAAYETGVDPKLIKNIMLVETGMKPRTNSLGYSGFAQTNQASIDTVNRAMGTNFTVDQMNDPYQAAKYIANYLKHTSNVQGASKIDELLVGYNWGPARINRYRKGAKLPAETEDYIKKFKGLLPVDETFNPNTNNTMSLGGILSAANMALDLYNQAEAKANARTADSFKNNMEARQKFVNDAEYLKGYNQSGSSRVEFYRNGGMHNLNARTMGNIGKFKKVGPNIFKVKGPKHSEGGVRMGNAEVEGGETVKITPNEIKVLSDNKKLFGYSPSVKLADRVSFGDPRIDREFERQFRIQESIKKFRGVDNADMKAKDGNTFKLWDTVPKILKDFSWSKLFDGSGKTSGKKFSMPEAATDDPLKLEDWMTSTTSGHWMDKEPSTPVTGMPMVGNPNAKLNTKSSLGDMAPMLIDNIGNLIMDLNRPKIPTPVMMPPVKFKTDIDVNPQINAITSANRGAVSDINRNISDANVATALRMKLANQEGMSKQQILAGETNTETDLFNKQASANLYPNMINTNKINEYAEDTVNRKLGIQASLSQNLGNLARDFTHAIDTKNLRNLDKNRLKAELFKDTDAQLDRAIMFSDIFDDIIATDYQELLNNANLDPRIAKALAYRYNKMQKQ